MKKLSLLCCLLGSPLALATEPMFMGLYGGGYTSLRSGGRSTFGLGVEGAYFVMPELSLGIYVGSLPSGNATFVYGAKGRYHFPQVQGLYVGVFAEGWRVSETPPFPGYNSGDWGFLGGFDHPLNAQFSVGGELQLGDLFRSVNYLATGRLHF